MNKKYCFIGKTLWFLKEKILVVGDLHLGYEASLRARGLEVPIGQFQEIRQELEKTIQYIKAKYGKIEEIIFLGDVKHHFGFKDQEKKEILNLINFLRKYLENENRIIFIRGNHEKNETNGKLLDYYLEKDMAFIHGHREFLEIYDKNINLIIMGHLHPTITIQDKMKIKKEKYKCFLVGKYKHKEVVILPSFISITEGVSINEFTDEKGYDFSIIPQGELENFEAYACREVGEDALNFGKLKSI